MSGRSCELVLARYTEILGDTDADVGILNTEKYRISTKTAWTHLKVYTFAKINCNLTI